MGGWLEAWDVGAGCRCGIAPWPRQGWVQPRGRAAATAGSMGQRTIPVRGPA